ncbi:MAG: sigma-70 family RNA polymerase sigma factor [Ruminococcus sp.]|nr:sigma-70 family RNA polymerase sigma factor [Ruminococcus sp.]
MNEYIDNMVSYKLYNQSGISNSNDVNMAKDLLLNAIDTVLTEKQKKYVKMHYFMDKPMNQIAKELGVNPSTVTRTIQSAKKRLSILSFFLK